MPTDTSVTTTRFVVEMACGANAERDWADIAQYPTEVEARSWLAAILVCNPPEAWRVVRVDETRTVLAEASKAVKP